MTSRFNYAGAAGPRVRVYTRVYAGQGEFIFGSTFLNVT